MTEANPREVNLSLLNTLFKFAPHSKLKNYLTNKTGIDKTYYTLGELLTILKDIIRGEGQFDKDNPSIILCTSELEDALNMKALHVTEICKLVLTHLIKIPDHMLRKAAIDQPIGPTIVNPPRMVVNDSGPLRSQEQTHTQPNRMRVFRTQNPLVAFNIARQDRFYVKKKFLEVMRTLPDVDLQQQSFTFEEIANLFSKYMLSKQDELFDDRNIRVALIQNDPLAAAFGMKSFHRCQVNILLRAQLIPITPSSTTQQVEIDTSAITPSTSHIANPTTEEVQGDMPDHHSEYTNDTEEETSRPKHAMGEGFLSSGDTDDHIDVVSVQSVNITPIDNGYFGDNENAVMSEQQDESTLIDQPKDQKQQVKCAACKKLTPDIKFNNLLCTWCWRLRKQWLPYRPRRRNNKSYRRRRREKRRATDDRTLIHSLPATPTNSQIASIPSSSTPITQLTTQEQEDKHADSALLCGMCCHTPRDTGFVHGTSAHLYACYQCAKRAWKVSPKCPICRRKISGIIRII